MGGFPSGGTDLTKTVLNAHPEIYISGELLYLSFLVGFGYNASTILEGEEQIMPFKETLRKLDPWNNFENIEDNSLDSGRRTIKELLYHYFSSQTRLVWGNKNPQNSENMRKLLKLAPDAYFLIVIRDIRDICLSQQKKWGRSSNVCSNKWNTRMINVVEDAKSALAGHVLFIKFEDLIAETELVTKNVCDFIGVEWSDRMLEHHKYVTEVVDGKINYGQPIKRSNTSKWTKALLPRKVKRIEEIAYRAMQQHGYEPAYAQREKPLGFAERAIGLIRDIYAMIFIGNRANRHNSIWRRLYYFVFEVRKRLYRSKVVG